MMEELFFGTVGVIDVGGVSDNGSVCHDNVSDCHVPETPLKQT